MKKVVSIFSVFALVVGETFAQPTPPPPPNIAIPLDVVVSVLILSGMIFGAITLFRKPKAAKLA